MFRGFVVDRKTENKTEIEGSYMFASNMNMNYYYNKGGVNYKELISYMHNTDVNKIVNSFNQKILPVFGEADGHHLKQGSTYTLYIYRIPEFYDDYYHSSVFDKSNFHEIIANTIDLLIEIMKDGKVKRYTGRHNKLAEKVYITDENKFIKFSAEMASILEREKSYIRKALGDRNFLKKTSDFNKNFDDIESFIKKEFGEVHKLLIHDHPEDELIELVIFDSEKMFFIGFGVLEGVMISLITKEEYEECMRRKIEDEHGDEEYEEDEDDDYYYDDEDDECSDLETNGETIIECPNRIDFYFARKKKTGEYGIYVFFDGKEHKKVSYVGKFGKLN